MTGDPVGATLCRELEPRSRRKVDVAIKGNELIVANSGYANVLVFARNADGDVAPLRVIGGPATGFNAPFALAFGVLMLPDVLFANGFE